MDVFVFHGGKFSREQQLSQSARNENVANFDTKVKIIGTYYGKSYDTLRWKHDQSVSVQNDHYSIILYDNNTTVSVLLKIKTNSRKIVFSGARCRCTTDFNIEKRFFFYREVRS